MVAHPTSHSSIYTRGYVTITRLVTRENRGDLDAYVAELVDKTVRFGRDEQPPVPAGAELILAIDLTTHAEHFLGAACNRLLLYEEHGQAYLRAVGTWDPLPWYIDQGYRRAGYEAQHAFWGADPPERSMLQQIALAVAQRSDDSAARTDVAGMTAATTEVNC